MEMIWQMVLYPMAGVAFATLSRLQDEPERFEAAYLRLLNIGALVAFPLVLGAGIVAKEAVPLLFGRQWSESATVFAVLSLITVPFVLFNYLVPQAVTANGRAGDLVIVFLVQLTAVVAISFFAAPYGLVVFTAAYVFRAYLVLPYQQYVLSKSGISPKKCLAVIRLPLLASGLMGGTLLAVKPFLMAWTPGEVGFLMLSIVLGGAIYILAIGLFGRSLIRSYLNVARDALRSQPPPEG
jgi:O-antigen/teichoic acid export membrane protein